MSRRGLVSKSMGPTAGGSPGGAALMPKGGEKPSTANHLPIEEVAAKLRVQSSQILEWIQRDKLRGTDAGVKPYDLKKFQLDHQDELRKAQAQALKDSQRPVEKTSNKGGGNLFSKFVNVFAKGKSDSESPSDPNLAKENRRLKDELKTLRSNVNDSGTELLEEKVRFLESKLSRSGELEAEVVNLRKQLKSASQGSDNSELERQLEATKRELAQSQEQAQQNAQLRQLLENADLEREQLMAKLQKASSQNDSTAWQEQLETSKQALHHAEDRVQSLLSEEENQRLRFQASLDEHEQTIKSLRQAIAEAEAVPAQPISNPLSQAETESAALIEELLALQETNLNRFARLHDLHQQAQVRLAQTPTASDKSVAEADFVRLQSEFDTLRVKHQSLLEARENNTPSSQEYAEQLAAARVTTTRLKTENNLLKTRLSEADIEGWKQRVDELQKRLDGTRVHDASLELVETELRTTRKNLQNREAQVQKIAGRLQENERGLKKALKESTRLTELLIERENRLRDLSTEYEQEYRDKVDNLDRQVSGLQWKLSLREERIASLESEVSELRKNAARS